MTNYCPACEVGVLHPTVVDKQMSYDGTVVDVLGIEIGVCPVCAERVVLSEQSRRNEVRYADAKRSHDALKRSHEIVHWRESLGVTQVQAAALLGGGANAFSKYERGEVIQSRSMDLLMRVSEKFPDVRRFLADRAGVQLAGGWVESDINTQVAVCDIAAFRVRREASLAANQPHWENESSYEIGDANYG